MDLWWSTTFLEDEGEVGHPRVLARVFTRGSSECRWLVGRESYRSCLSDTGEGATQSVGCLAESMESHVCR